MESSIIKLVQEIENLKDRITGLESEITAEIQNCKEESESLESKFEKLFIELIDGMTLFKQDKYPESVFWKNKEGKILFEQNFKNGSLLCSYDYFWIVFKQNAIGNYDKINELTAIMVEKHLKWKGLTPSMFVL